MDAEVDPSMRLQGWWRVGFDATGQQFFVERLLIRGVEFDVETALLGGHLHNLDVSAAELDLGEPACVVHDEFGTRQFGVELDGAVHVSDSEAHRLESHSYLLIFLVVHMSSGMIEVEAELSSNFDYVTASRLSRIGSSMFLCGVNCSLSAILDLNLRLLVR